MVVGDDEDPLFPESTGVIEIDSRSGSVRRAPLDALTPAWLWQNANVAAEYVGYFKYLSPEIPPYIVIRPSSLVAAEKYSTGELVTHEIGHAVGFAIADQRVPGSSRNQKIGVRAHGQLLADYGISSAEIAEVSDYATTSPVEAFAEIYMHFFSRVNSTDRGLARKFETLLKTELPDHALAPRFMRFRPDKQEVVCTPSCDCSYR